MTAMSDRPLTAAEVAEAKERRIMAMGLQMIEDNPLTSDEVAMFEMFEREAWSHERCREYILSLPPRNRAIAAE